MRRNLYCCEFSVGFNDSVGPFKVGSWKFRWNFIIPYRWYVCFLQSGLEPCIDTIGYDKNWFQLTIERSWSGLSHRMITCQICTQPVTLLKCNYKLRWPYVRLSGGKERVRLVRLFIILSFRNAASLRYNGRIGRCRNDLVIQSDLEPSACEETYTVHTDWKVIYYNIKRTWNEVACLVSTWLPHLLFVLNTVRVGWPDQRITN